MALEKVTKDPGTQTQLRHSPPPRELGADGEFISEIVRPKNRERVLERLDCMGSSEMFKSRRNGSEHD